MATELIPETRSADAREQARMVATITTAFASDPVVRWIYPEPDRYLTYFPRLINALGGRAFPQGSAYCIGDCVGVALWLPPDVHFDEAAVVALFEESIPPERRSAVYELLDALDAHHPAEPHWYLPLIGVDPLFQRKGFGGALMRHGLQRVDRRRYPAYLEASSPGSARLYERHGFVVAARLSVGDGPPVFPMVRPGMPQD